MEVEFLPDSRHKHLLEPIRDLATNWKIDLASELEDYLHELESVAISFDEGEAINFVEAALLIQGSACVYSKKVEYLHNLLYKCLEIVVEKKKSREKNAFATEGVDTDALANDLSFLPLLDQHLIDGKNIDLTDSKDFNYEKTRTLTTVCRPMMGALDRVEGDKQQFKINDCVIHMSGALLFRAKDGMLLDGSLERIRTGNPLAALPFGSPKAVMQTPAAALAETAETPVETAALEQAVPVAVVSQVPESEFPDLGPEPSSEDDLDEKHAEPLAAAQPDLKEAAADPLGTQMVEEEDQDALPDPWQLVDPHEAPRTKPKPFRKVVPKAPRGEVKEASSTSFVNGLFADPAEQNVRRASEKHSIKAPYWPQFAGAFVARVQNMQRSKREQKTKEKLVQQRKIVQLPLPLQPVVESDSDEERDDIAPIFSLDMEEKQEVNEWNEVEEEKVSLEASEEMTILDRSYEDACREHVGATLDKATKFLNETQLSKRVAEWQAKLDPTLAAEEARPPFDIHQYGRELMGIMMEGHGPTEPLTSIKMDFHQAVQGKARYDVCRYFLAALQLANNANVNIAASQVHIPDEKDDIPSMGLQLLSLEAAEVNIESQEGSAGPKRPRGKKKAHAVDTEDDVKMNGDEEAFLEDLFEDESEEKTPAAKPSKAAKEPKKSQGTKKAQEAKKSQETKSREGEAKDSMQKKRVR